MEKIIYKLEEENCCRDFKKEYECYLENEKCNRDRLEKEESELPDNTYGINPYVFNNSRNKVYLNYTGRDRFKWLNKNNNEKNK